MNKQIQELMKIKQIFETTDKSKVNLYLDWGWKIVAIRSGEFQNEGYVFYSLAWFGETIPETPDPWKKPSDHSEIA